MEKYKIFIYIIVTLTCSFALSGINFNNFFKKNKVIEAKTFIIVMALALSYLATNFIVDFLEVSKIL
ncbi:MAG TPA: DUF1146 family protein [Bacilli bacterium]|nr:DUF1146 family protein [Bacilli bacterium]